MTHRLQTTISDALWVAIQEQSRLLGKPIRQVVQDALAEALDIAHHSMFQVSTSGAIVEGLYQGAVTVGELRRHGDTGVGTFEDLNGEMIMVDGHCFQARSDGSVIEASDATATPFAVVVPFAADETHTITDITSYDDLTARLDAYRTSDNEFVAWRIAGTCSALRVRAACRHDSGVPLVQAVADQAIFEFADMPVAMVGFWSPAYAQAVAVPGYHLHGVSDDRAHGGHVFDLTAARLEVAIHHVSELRLALPETEAFLKAQLGASTEAALDQTEHQG